MASQRPRIDEPANRSVPSQSGRRNSNNSGRANPDARPSPASRLPSNSGPIGSRSEGNPRLPVVAGLRNPNIYVDPPTRPEHFATPISPPQPRLSQLLVDFLKIPLGDYKACERYCRDKPGIWDEDVDELRTLAIRYLNEGKDENARRCAERWWIITNAQHRELDTADANAYVKSLIKNDDKFQDQLDQIMSKLGQEVDNTGPAAPLTGNAPAPLAKSNPQPSASNVAPIQTIRGSHVGPTINSMPMASGRISIASRQPQPDVLPLRTRTSEPQSSYQDQGFSRAPSQSTTLNPRTRRDEQHHTSPDHVVSQAPPPDPDGAETVATLDIGTIGNQPAQISGRKKEAGPRLDLLDDDYEDRDILDASYILRHGAEAVKFFVKGRVFAMVWHENAGSPNRPRTTEISESLDKPFHRHTLNKDGIVIFSHIRRFVIVKARPGRRYCWAIPINTYAGYGLTKKNMHNEEKQAHAIIHASDQNPVRIKGEIELNKQPISVEMAKGELLKSSSRLHFGKMQSIEWNIKVKNVGVITNPASIRRLTLYFNQEVRKGDDTGTETEAGPSRSNTATQKK